MKLSVKILIICSFLLFPVRIFAGELPPGNASGWTKGIPASYFQESKKPGRVERITYSSKDYAGNNAPVEKVANVYLPAGYDSSGAATRYDVFYMMHGWSGTADELFGYGGGQAKRLLDNMIEKGDMRPLIVVAPTFDAENKPQEFDRAVTEVKLFHRDLLENLMPAVEGRYRTYAPLPTKEGFAASRDHRGFGGFSMGSVTTWEQFIQNSDYISYFLPMSSACWHYGGYGAGNPKDNTDLFVKTVSEKGLNTRGYFIYACTGTHDTLRYEMDAQMNEMFSRKTVFTPEHVVYYLKNGGMHDNNAALEYLYNGLPLFFNETAAPEFYDIYSNFEKHKDPSKNETGLYLFRTLKSPSPGTVLLTAMGDAKNAFPKARELTRQGYNVYLPVIRGDKKAAEDSMRAEAFISDNAEYLGTGPVTVRLSNE